MAFEHPGLRDNGRGNVIEIHPTAKIDASVNIRIDGNENILKIGEKVILRGMNIIFSGDKNVAEVGPGCNLRGAFHLRQTGSRLFVGAGTTFVGAHLFAMEGRAIDIGEDCMFSANIFVRTSDEHSILDIETLERLNKAQDVTLGRHVWVGEGVTVSKGVKIADGCVIGARSYVSKSLTRANAIYAGAPPRLIREGIKWDRKLLSQS